MHDHSSLARLLKLVLSLPEDVPVFTTPSFRSWLGPGETDRWPPAENEGGVWLVDTRDTAGRELVRRWKKGRAGAAFDAALVLSGSGVPGSPVRRALRRLRYPGTRRQKEARVSSSLPTTPATTRLAFKDGRHVPAEFEIERIGHSTGTAFLMTRDQPFHGGIWSLVGERLGDPEAQVLELQLRVRGAAVSKVRVGPRHFVVRIVPAGRLQDVVLKNHSALVRLRERLDGSTSLLRLIPEPVLAEIHGSTAVLAETCLQGTLAWKVASGARADVIRRNAIGFLDTLREATERRGPVGPEAMAELLAPDLTRLEEAKFIGHEVRRRLHEELSSAGTILSGLEMPLHTSHGDYGYGNLLVDPHTGELTGVIDWDTARAADLPGIDRVNLEIQARRTVLGEGFPEAMREVWRSKAAHDALLGPGGPQRVRALFGTSVCRYILRAATYPDVYRRDAAAFEQALMILARIGHHRVEIGST